jgi:hypothetical protein
MTTRSKISNFIDTFASAVAVSNAVRENRTPRARDLAQLGIDPMRVRELPLLTNTFHPQGPYGPWAGDELSYFFDCYRRTNVR